MGVVPEMSEIIGVRVIPSDGSQCKNSPQRVLWESGFMAKSGGKAGGFFSTAEGAEMRRERRLENFM